MQTLRQSPPAILACLAIAALLISGPILAQQSGGERLSRECRQEIRALCGGQRSQLRSCLREKFTRLSDDCSAELHARIAQRTGDRGAGRHGSGSATPDRTVSFGSHERQKVDVYSAGVPAGAPLVLFVHGGGWAFGNHSLVQDKPAHFNAGGIAFASTGYRVLPHGSVENQAADVGAAIRALREQAEDIGFDPDRIVLMGHSAGAHLSALVATDPAYAGSGSDAIRGVVLLDGAGYDVVSTMADRNAQARRLYDAAFGSDPVRQAALSPVTHVGGPDAPHWLVLHVAERRASREQSEKLALLLSQAGASATAQAITGTDHGRMNRELGTEAGAMQTRAVDDFLARILR